MVFNRLLSSGWSVLDDFVGTPPACFESLMEVISRAWRDVASALSQIERRLKRWPPKTVLVTDFNCKSLALSHKNDC